MFHLLHQRDKDLLPFYAKYNDDIKTLIIKYRDPMNSLKKDDIMNNLEEKEVEEYIKSNKIIDLDILYIKMMDKLTPEDITKLNELP